MTDTGTDGPPPMSFSRHSSLATCGERYRLERVLKIDGGSAWALVGGNTFHAVVERLLREKIAETGAADV